LTRSWTAAAGRTGSWFTRSTAPPCRPGPATFARSAVGDTTSIVRCESGPGERGTCVAEAAAIVHPETRWLLRLWQTPLVRFSEAPDTGGMDTLQLLADAMLPPGDDATLTLRLRAEALCLAVAPELRQRPFYVMLTSDLPAAERSRTTAGHVSPTMDLYLRPHLGEQWRGRGPAMVVRDCLLQGEVAATLAGFDERLRPIVEPRLWAVALPNFYRVVLHELAHIFALGGRYEPLGAAGEGAIRSHGYGGLVADIDRRIEADPDLDRQRPYHSPANWLRAVIHLRHRATALGVALSPEPIERWGCSPFPLYVEALGDEPERFAGLPVAEILQRPLPAEYRRLLLADIDLHSTPSLKGA
jgi:hypothetical protein